MSRSKTRPIAICRNTCQQHADELGCNLELLNAQLKAHRQSQMTKDTFLKCDKKHLNALAETFVARYGEQLWGSRILSALRNDYPQIQSRIYAIYKRKQLDRRVKPRSRKPHEPPPVDQFILEASNLHLLKIHLIDGIESPPQPGLETIYKLVGNDPVDFANKATSSRQLKGMYRVGDREAIFVLDLSPDSHRVQVSKYSYGSTMQFLVAWLPDQISPPTIQPHIIKSYEDQKLSTVIQRDNISWQVTPYMTRVWPANPTARDFYYLVPSSPATDTLPTPQGSSSTFMIEYSSYPSDDVNASISKSVPEQWRKEALNEEGNQASAISCDQPQVQHSLVEAIRRRDGYEPPLRTMLMAIYQSIQKHLNDFERNVITRRQSSRGADLYRGRRVIWVLGLTLGLELIKVTRYYYPLDKEFYVAWLPDELSPNADKPHILHRDRRDRGLHPKQVERDGIRWTVTAYRRWLNPVEQSSSTIYRLLELRALAERTDVFEPMQTKQNDTICAQRIRSPSPTASLSTNAVVSPLTKQAEVAPASTIGKQPLMTRTVSFVDVELSLEKSSSGSEGTSYNRSQHDSKFSIFHGEPLTIAHSDHETNDGGALDSNRDLLRVYQTLLKEQAFPGPEIVSHYLRRLAETEDDAINRQKSLQEKRKLVDEETAHLRCIEDEQISQRRYEEDSAYLRFFNELNDMKKILRQNSKRLKRDLLDDASTNGDALGSSTITSPATCRLLTRSDISQSNSGVRAPVHDSCALPLSPRTLSQTYQSLSLQQPSLPAPYHREEPWNSECSNTDRACEILDDISTSDVSSAINVDDLEIVPAAGGSSGPESLPASTSTHVSRGPDDIANGMDWIGAAVRDDHEEGDEDRLLNIIRGMTQEVDNTRSTHIKSACCSTRLRVNNSPNTTRAPQPVTNRTLPGSGGICSVKQESDSVDLTSLDDEHEERGRLDSIISLQRDSTSNNVQEACCAKRRTMVCVVVPPVPKSWENVKKIKTVDGQ